MLARYMHLFSVWMRRMGFQASSDHTERNGNGNYNRELGETMTEEKKAVAPKTTRKAPVKKKIAKSTDIKPKATKEKPPVAEAKPEEKKVPEKMVAKKKKFDEEAFYKKYGHVVRGSIREVEPGTTINGVVAVHGRICDIKCQETGESRTINVQDAWQVKYTKEVQKQKARDKIRDRRKARIEKEKAEQLQKAG